MLSYPLGSRRRFVKNFTNFLARVLAAVILVAGLTGCGVHFYNEEFSTPHGRKCASGVSFFPTPESAGSLADAEATLRGAEGGERFRQLYVVNATTLYTVEILSSPFEGVTLTPGGKSTRQPVPVGNYVAKFKWYRIGGSGSSTKTVNVAVSPDRTTPLRVLDP